MAASFGGAAVMVWQGTVNPPLFGANRFDPYHLHQVRCESIDTFLTRGSSASIGSATADLFGHRVRVSAKVRNATVFRSVRIEVITADCLSAYRGSIPLQTANVNAGLLAVKTSRRHVILWQGSIP